jgi:hypothetical protein
MQLAVDYSLAELFILRGMLQALASLQMLPKQSIALFWHCYSWQCRPCTVPRLISAPSIGCQPARGVLSPRKKPKFGSLTELQQELRLIEEETGIAPDPTTPIAGYVRAVAKTGNARAQRLLVRLKAALIPPR